VQKLFAIHRSNQPRIELEQCHQYKGNQTDFTKLCIDAVDLAVHRPELARPKVFLTIVETLSNQQHGVGADNVRLGTLCLRFHRLPMFTLP
jgi:hypothetical protein